MYIYIYISIYLYIYICIYVCIYIYMVKTQTSLPQISMRFSVTLKFFSISIKQPSCAKVPHLMISLKIISLIWFWIKT